MNKYGRLDQLRQASQFKNNLSISTSSSKYSTDNSSSNNIPPSNYKSNKKPNAVEESINSMSTTRGFIKGGTSFNHNQDLAKLANLNKYIEPTELQKKNDKLRQIIELKQSRQSPVFDSFKNLRPLENSNNLKKKAIEGINNNDFNNTNLMRKFNKS